MNYRVHRRAEERERGQWNWGNIAFFGAMLALVMVGIVIVIATVLHP